MNNEDTSDVLDMKKENIRPLKQGRKPIQLETALHAQNSEQIQKKLNKEKELHENAIRTYEGNDPLGPRFEYIKWLEQMSVKSGPESSILNVLIEETVQKFKNDAKYKQDFRFVQILINFIENQSNAIELYQTVYNQGLGTQCALFYRAWADLLDRHNDFKRVDQIYLLGIQSDAKPVEELEQAHLQFQLSIARKMLNGQLSKEEYSESDEGRRALGILKKSELHSGVRHGLGHSVAKLPQTKNVNRIEPTIKVFEDNDENRIHEIAAIDCDLAPKGSNKENAVKPGPWTKPKKSHSTVPNPVSAVNFKVHQDNSVEPVTKLHGVKVPNALRSRNLICPIAIFEAPDPTKRVMYCKEKVYAAGRDIQLEEIRAEMYFKREKDLAMTKNETCTIPEKSSKPTKKVILSNENSNTNNIKVPLHTEVDPLSQSVTVNTKVAIDLVQQMWNSPTSDQPQEVNSKGKKQAGIDEPEVSKNKDMPNQPNFIVYEDNLLVQPKTETAVKDFQVKPKEIQKNTVGFSVYTDDDDQPNSIKVPQVYVDDGDKKIKTSKNSAKIKCDNQSLSCATPAVQNKKMFKHQAKKISSDNCTNKITNNPVLPIGEKLSSPVIKIPSIDENDDFTCSTKAFTGLLSSSTPLSFGGTKSRSYTGNSLQSFKAIGEKGVKETDEFHLGKSLSMILEASKERNSSTSSGLISTTSSLKPEQQSKIDFGDFINPFDGELLTKLLQKVVKFPNDHHLSGYIELESDVPSMRSEFKLGNNKMVFLGTIGKGSYGRVVKAQLDDKTVMEKALKIQKPACSWEWYICKEIKHRLQDPKKFIYFIDMTNMYIFKNGSIISMEFCPYGTLLSVIQTYKTAMNRQIPTPVAACLSLQTASALKYLHQCQIIHGDLKPDNVMVKSLPNESLQPCIQLIDFGRSIDMTLFPQDTVFTYSVKTADFVCHEMREKLPWTYQTDYYGLAGIIYTVLMSDVMHTQKLRKIWVPKKPLPRYIEKDPWGTILSSLLNIESCTNLPNLDEIIEKLTKYFSNQQKVVVSHHFANLKNVLKNN